MSEPFSTSDLIAQVRERQEAYPLLKKSHHFVFDCPLDPTYRGKPDFVWLGLNPGSDDKDWARFDGNTEETRDYDFQAEHGRSRGSTRRLNQLCRFLGPETFRRTTHSELFFWCSRNTGAAFAERFGCTFKEHPHWDFCCAMNLALIQRARPQAVLAESRWNLPLYETRLGLESPRTYRDDAGSVLIEERRLDCGTPFYCFDHLSARGCHAERRPQVREQLARLLRGASGS